jgi:hypothetical protein
VLPPVTFLRWLAYLSDGVRTFEPVALMLSARPGRCSRHRLTLDSFSCLFMPVWVAGHDGLDVVAQAHGFLRLRVMRCRSFCSKKKWWLGGDVCI